MSPELILVESSCGGSSEGRSDQSNSERGDRSLSVDIAAVDTRGGTVIVLEIIAWWRGEMVVRVQYTLVERGATLIQIEWRGRGVVLGLGSGLTEAKKSPCTL